MDKKKKMNTRRIQTLFFFVALSLSLSAQVDKIQFCGIDYQYQAGKDSVTLFLKVLDSNGKKAEVQTRDLGQSLKLFEDGKEIIASRGEFSAKRGIPQDYTISVLLDLGIPQAGKDGITKVIKDLVDSAPDSCVYLSFFGNEVSSSKLITRQNFDDIMSEFSQEASEKYFFDALLAKLVEIGGGKEKSGEDFEIGALVSGYKYNNDIARRAESNPDKNILFVFTDGGRSSNFDKILYYHVTDYQKEDSHIGPRIYAFYYDSGNGLDEDVKLMLDGVTGGESIPEDRRGEYVPSDDLSSILEKFAQAVSEQMYDFVYVYKATEGKVYDGKIVYSAAWDNNKIGDDATYSVGTPETPWPINHETLSDIIIKYLIALIVTFLTIAFFFCIMKILIPWFKSKSFSMKYYKTYVQEQNIQKRICHYCKQPILPGEQVVAKCKHIMHVHCWKQNDYRCAEYGQNCNIGVQEHVDWSHLLDMRSIRDCQQAIAGIFAGLVSWIVYELMGRGSFISMSEGIVKMFLTNKEQQDALFDLCVTKVSAFMTIGLLLGFFLSFIFRYNDEYRKKDVKIYLKIIGLSLLSAVIGVLSFAFGSIIFCMMLSSAGTLYIPWYCSLPAYLLFSVCTSLSLTIKSSIPVQSAMIGGLCSAAIGFLVLYFTSLTSTRYSWMNMLLDFVIYGGGLGASLVTVRMLAEKYFLVIQNGIKAGTRIPIHKWMNATGGGNKVSIGMTGDCEIQMNWEKSNKVAKEHAVLFIDHARSVPVIKPLALGVVYNSRAELPVSKAAILTNGDTFKIGDTIFRYEETD